MVKGNIEKPEIPRRNDKMYLNISVTTSPLDLYVSPIYTESKNEKQRVGSENHGQKWVNADLTTVLGDVAKAPSQMAWHQKSLFGNRIGPGNGDYDNMSLG